MKHQGFVAALLVAGMLSCDVVAQDAASQPANPAKHSATAGRATSLSKAWEDAALRSSQFNRDVAEAVMQRLAEGLRGHSLTKTQSLFAMERFSVGYREKMVSDFDSVERFDIFYKIQETAMEGERGIIVTDFDLQITPRSSDAASQHTHAHLRLEVERVGTGSAAGQWRIVTITPSNFLFAY